MAYGNLQTAIAKAKPKWTLRITGGRASLCPGEARWVCGGGPAGSSQGGGAWNDEAGVLTLTSGA